MHKITNVLPLENFKIKVTFTDGAEGVVDLSELKGKGIFSAWNDEAVFNAVSVNNESHTVSWPGGIDLCPDVLYAEITGQSIDTVIKTGAVV